MSGWKNKFLEALYSWQTNPPLVAPEGTEVVNVPGEPGVYRVETAPPPVGPIEAAGAQFQASPYVSVGTAWMPIMGDQILQAVSWGSLSSGITFTEGGGDIVKQKDYSPAAGCGRAGHEEHTVRITSMLVQCLACNRTRNHSVTSPEDVAKWGDPREIRSELIDLGPTFGADGPDYPPDDDYHNDDYDPDDDDIVDGSDDDLSENA